MDRYEVGYHLILNSAWLFRPEAVFSAYRAYALARNRLLLGVIVLTLSLPSFIPNLVSWLAGLV